MVVPDLGSIRFGPGRTYSNSWFDEFQSDLKFAIYAKFGATQGWSGLLGYLWADPRFGLRFRTGPGWSFRTEIQSPSNSDFGNSRLGWYHYHGVRTGSSASYYFLCFGFNQLFRLSSWMVLIYCAQKKRNHITTSRSTWKVESKQNCYSSIWNEIGMGRKMWTQNKILHNRESSLYYPR